MGKKKKAAKKKEQPPPPRSYGPLVDTAPEVKVTQRGGVTYLDPNPAAEQEKSKSSVPASRFAEYANRPSANELMAREQACIDSLLLRFKNIVELACQPEGDVSLEVAAAQTFQMKVETAALIQAAEDLLKLTRELKELWLVGPIRTVGQDKDESKIDDDVKAVNEIIQTMVQVQGQTEKKAALLESLAKDEAEEAAKQTSGQPTE